MIEPDLNRIWVYLSASPLLGLTMTLVAYSLAHRLYLRSGSNPRAESGGHVGDGTYSVSAGDGHVLR